MRKEPTRRASEFHAPQKQAPDESAEIASSSRYQIERRCTGTRDEASRKGGM